jgi:glycosyltransferase involved in cell wall biosynthesis
MADNIAFLSVAQENSIVPLFAADVIFRALELFAIIAIAPVATWVFAPMVVKYQIDVFDAPRTETWHFDDAKSFLPTTQAWLVELLQAMQQLGHYVTVYWDGWDFESHGIFFRRRKEYDGKSQVAIAWETPYAFPQTSFDADITVYWSDSGETWPGEFDYSQLDLVFAQSNWHGEEIEKKIEKKIDGRANLTVCSAVPGTDHELFKSCGAVKRVRNQLLYASSYEKGLKELLAIWGDVRKEFRAARLYVTRGSGWSSRRAGIAESAWRSPYDKILRQPGVYELGAVTRQEMFRLYLESDILCLPAVTTERFPTSVYYAQAAGCIPVTTKEAALNEINFCGVAGKLPKYKEGLFELMDNEPDKSIIRDNMRQLEFPSWADVASYWTERITEQVKAKA